MTTETDSLNWVPFSVPLDVAQHWITNWIDADPTGKSLDPTDMRAFVVRRADFVELLAQQDTEFIRLYVGRKKEIDIDQIRPCLLLVSAAYEKDVNPAKPDSTLIVDLVGTMTVPTGETVQEQTETYQVFDFSHGCPPACDTGSPLFIGQADARCD